MNKKLHFLLAGFLIFTLSGSLNAQHSVARAWNEALLQAIREDFARPTVHARNLFHVSVAMYDAWAAYDETAETYFLGKTVNGFNCPFFGVSAPTNIEAIRKEAMSYASFRLLNHRFKNSPGADSSLPRFRNLMINLGYDPDVTTLDYRNSGAGLGNYLAEFLITYGLQDGANEQEGYENSVYEPVNSPLQPEAAGNAYLEDPNRWQPLAFINFIDQSGNPFSNATPNFIGAEWGQVAPFSLEVENRGSTNGSDHLYHDPGPPPSLNQDGQSSEEYMWGFSLVAKWSSHLDPNDGVIWDISPSSMGNMDISSFPTAWEDYQPFYEKRGQGDIGNGHDINPKTGNPYESQMVKRGDYVRVLAEFWADGPDSETPPGHWFTILNYVSDHPDFIKKFRGEGEELSDLEWDVKAYFTLGGAMHDAAISAWDLKGYYDYIRPISAIRYMAGKGQSTENNLPNYDAQGIPLVPGFTELVQINDPLAGANNENLNKIKIYAWKGPDYIGNPATDVAGAGWILAEQWWPYQRPTFVTPPFAGYVSGHSTFSRAAAEVMTLLTGDAFFPGGMGEFIAPKNEFLVFEKGPSQDVILQWATYRDAADQCSLSRIWGGIHPPADDLPGRRIGKKIGVKAFHLAASLFHSSKTKAAEENHIVIYPNPVDHLLNIKTHQPNSEIQAELINILGKIVKEKQTLQPRNNQTFQLEVNSLKSGIYLLRLTTDTGVSVHRIIKR